MNPLNLYFLANFIYNSTHNCAFMPNSAKFVTLWYCLKSNTLMQYGIQYKYRNGLQKTHFTPNSPPGFAGHGNILPPRHTIPFLAAADFNNSKNHDGCNTQNAAKFLYRISDRPAFTELGSSKQNLFSILNMTGLWDPDSLSCNISVLPHSIVTFYLLNRT